MDLCLGHKIGIDEIPLAVNIDVQRVIEGRLLFQANSGGGKSYALRKFCEVTHGKVQQIILDVEGEFSSLREKFDYILVGKDGDIPVNLRASELLAKRLLELNTSAIIDLYELKHHERKRFVKNFLDSLMQLPKELWHPCLIIIDECLSEDTEILTENGWKKFFEIQIGENALSYNKDKNLFEFNPIEAILIKKFNGKINQLYNQDSIDALVTDEHRVLCSTRTTSSKKKDGIRGHKMSDLKFLRAKNLPTSFNIPICGKYVNNTLLSINDDLIKIIGWILTDGWRHNFKRGSHIYEISQAKKQNIKEFSDTIKRRFPESSIYKRKRKNRFILNHKTKKLQPDYTFYLGKKATVELDELLNGEPHRIPRKILNNCSIRQLKILFNSMVQGDGTIQVSKNGFQKIVFFAGLDKLLADDFQELSVRLGFSSIINQKKSNNIIVMTSLKRKNATVRTKKAVYYNGKIWDITIKNHAFLVRRNGKPFVTGNCHIFAPESKSGEAESLDSVKDLATRGRKRGFALVAATQRLSKLSKDVVAELNTKLIGRSSLDVDMKRSAFELGFTDKNDILSLRTLNKGEFYAFGPALTNVVTKIKVDKVVTKHPEAGSTYQKIKSAPAEKVKRVLEKLKDLPIEAEEELRTMDDLRRKVTELQRENTTLKHQKPVEQKQVIDKELLNKYYESGFNKGIKQTNDRLPKIIPYIKSSIRVVENIRKQNEQDLKKLFEDLSYLQGSVESLNNPIIPIQPVSIHLPYGLPNSKEAKQTEDKNLQPEPVQSQPETKLREGAMRMLKAVAMYHPTQISKNQVATLSGFSAGGGTFLTYISELKRAGWIYIQGDNISITDEGLANAGQVEPLSTNSNTLIEMWCGKFREGVGKMLRVITSYYPDGILKEELAEKTGFSVEGGTFLTYLSELKRNGLIEISSDMAKATKELFP